MFVKVNPFALIVFVWSLIINTITIRSAINFDIKYDIFGYKLTFNKEKNPNNICVKFYHYPIFIYRGFFFFSRLK